MQGTTSQLCLRRHNSLPTQKQSKTVLRRTHSEPHLRIEPKGLEITDANAHDIFKILNEMVSMQIAPKLSFKQKVKNNLLNINSNIYKDISEMKDDIALNLNFRDSSPIETFLNEEKKDIYEAVGIVKTLLNALKKERAKVLGQYLEQETIVMLSQNLSPDHFLVQEEVKRLKDVLNSTFRQMMHFFKDSELLKLQKPVQDFSAQEKEDLNRFLNKIIDIPVNKSNFSNHLSTLLKNVDSHLKTKKGLASLLQRFQKKEKIIPHQIMSGQGMSFSENVKTTSLKDILRTQSAIKAYVEPTTMPILENMIANGIEENLNILLDAFKAIEKSKDNVRQRISSVDEKKEIQMLMLGLTRKEVKEHLLNEKVPFDTDTILSFFAEEVKESAKKLLENFEAHPDNIRRLYHYRKLLDVSPSDIAFHIVSSLKKPTVEGNIIQEASSSAIHEEKTPEIQEVIDVKGKGKGKVNP